MLEVRAREEATRDCEVIVEPHELDLEAEWKNLHWRLRSLAQQRVALEAQEASLLLEAEESLLHKRLGYASLLEYMEHELHYGPHTANERLRVARELLSLPLIADQFRAGELSFSAVRELTRVATPDNEHLFLSKAQGRTARDVERMVSGLKRGDDPEAEPDPRLIKKRIFLEVSATTFARYRMMRTAIDKSREERISDDELFAMLLDAPTGTQESPPRVHVAMNTCKTCRKSAIAVGGEQLPIDATTAETLACDAVFIGDLDSDELTRPKPHIPDAMRRKVLQRDGHACVVPGCRSKRNLSVHHLRHRQHGGQHTLGNLCTLCDGHHLQHHDGRLVITGEAPDLTFQWMPDDGVATATTGPALEWVFDEADPVGPPSNGNSVPHGT